MLTHRRQQIAVKLGGLLVALVTLFSCGGHDLSNLCDCHPKEPDSVDFRHAEKHIPLPPGPATPYYTGPLPQYTGGPGLNVAGPDGETRSVKAVPCARSARETDGFTTCVGIPDQSPMKRRR